MARIPESTVNSVKSQTNIVDIVERYAPLKKSGSNYFAHCPFHEDNTPSFSVNEDKQLFKCFSCKRGGSVFTFIQEVEGLSFAESVLKVAELSNITIDQSIKTAIAGDPGIENTRYGKLVSLHEHAKDLYKHIILNAEVGEAAYDYLQNRGLSHEVIDEFDIGFSPRQRESLHLYLQTIDGLDLEDELLDGSGLFSHREDDSQAFKDRFANRIIFPLKNLQGKTVAFSGRYFENQTNQNFQTAKYLNSPETELFNKRSLLFNFDKARPHIKKSKEVVLFEGFMDVIAAWQAKVHNGLASMGTSLTSSHIQAISKVADNLIIAFDGDDAGVESTKRIIDELSGHPTLTIEIVSFPKKQDPDDYIQANGPEAFYNLIQHGRITSYQFMKAYYKRDYNLNNESERVKYIEQMIGEIAKIPSAIEKDMHSRELAEEFDLSLESIASQVKTQQTLVQQQRIDHRQQGERLEPRIELKSRNHNKTKIEITQEKLLNRLFYFPETLDYINHLSEEFEFKTEMHQRIFLLFLEYSQHEDNINHFVDYVSDADTKQAVSDIMWSSITTEPTEVEIMDYLHYINNVYPLEQERNAHVEELKEVKRQGNLKRELEITNELIKINRKLKQ